MAKTKKAGNNQLGYYPDWSCVATTNGTLVVYCHDHPHKWVSNYVPVHRVLMERKLGRLLKKKEFVRFIDGNRMNIKLDNLEVVNNKELRQFRKHLPLYRRVVCRWCHTEFYRGYYEPLRYRLGRLPFCTRAHLNLWKRAHAGRLEKAFAA